MTKTPDNISRDEFVYIMNEFYIEVLVAYGRATVHLGLQDVMDKHLGLLTSLVKGEVGIAPDWEAVKAKIERDGNVDA